MYMLNLLIEILREPAILVGLIACVGLVAQKETMTNVLKGSVKSTLGFVVLGGGASILIGSLDNFGAMFEYGFGINGVVTSNEATVAQGLYQYGSQIALVMLFAMIANMIFARFTRFKYIFLTGHHTLFMACVITVVLASGGIDGILLVMIGSIFLGFMMAVFPYIMQPLMRKVTNSDDIAMGHFGTSGYLVAAGIAKIVGKNSKSTEDMNLPKSLEFLKDTSVSISLTMFILFLIVSIAAGPYYVETELSNGTSFIVFALIQAITFSAGVFVILSGVNLVLAEIVPAFKGISEKIVPNAKPALDCPIVFPYASNAVLMGFISSFLGGIVGLIVLLLISNSGVNVPIVLPGVVPHFFTGAAAGVFANATGGRKGCFFGAFANGLLVTFLPVPLISALSSLELNNTTFSDTDYAVIGVILESIVNMFR